MYVKSTNFKENKERFKELAELIDEKLENEDQERNVFFNVLNEQFEDDEESVKSGLELLERIINRKLIKPYYYGFRSITQEEANDRKRYEQKSKITNFVHLLLHKVK